MPRYDSNEIGARDDETVMSKVTLTRVEALFYSPLVFFQIPDCEALNRQLLAETDAMRAGPSRATKSNRKAALRHRQPLVSLDGTAAVRVFADLVPPAKRVSTSSQLLGTTAACWRRRA
jgi:hypothetical protein